MLIDVARWSRKKYSEEIPKCKNPSMRKHRPCRVFARATVSDVTSNNLASASKIIIIDCETLDAPVYLEMTQGVIRAREEDEKYNGRESDYDRNYYKVKSSNVQHIVSDTIIDYT